MGITEFTDENFARQTLENVQSDCFKSFEMNSLCRYSDEV